MFIEPIIVGQVFYQELSEDALNVLREHATFVDTDSDLSEFMVSTGFLDEFETIDAPLAQELEEFQKMTENYAYIHIIYT